MKSKEIATIASLHYINDSSPGITRKRSGKKFNYYYPDGTRVTDEKTVERINSLAIPPAYSKVWISPLANGHIQATGRDSKNRKQYRYHPLWRKVREEDKFKNMIPFGKALPKIRKHIEDELNKPLTINKNQIICAIIYLLDNHFIRIGNAIYEKQNKSYGLTTLRKKHLSISSTQAVLEFDGKNAKPWHIVLKDKKIIKLLKKCEALPGYRLFKYIDESNNHCEISSQDINTYLNELTKHPFTAKDFRTWGACRETFYRLTQTHFTDEDSSQSSLKNIICEVATLLGHTPAICQKSYIYPEIITQWKGTQIKEWIAKRSKLMEDKDKLLLRWLEAQLNQ
ncbi:MAG TPA: DNA topoisomerase IB [Legionella sp.]|nr:DNA topoisomerase IB [Legionella sp.]